MGGMDGRIHDKALQKLAITPAMLSDHTTTTDPFALTGRRPSALQYILQTFFPAGFTPRPASASHTMNGWVRP